MDVVQSQMDQMDKQHRKHVSGAIVKVILVLLSM